MLLQCPDPSLPALFARITPARGPWVLVPAFAFGLFGSGAALRPCRSLTLSNGLKGPLPSSLGQLSALTQLTLNTNALNGTLPGPALGNLTSLQVLRLGSNALTGTTALLLAGYYPLPHRVTL